MEITFAKGRLRKLCESERALVRSFGKGAGRKVMARLADLRAAPNLEDMRKLPGNCHELTADRKGELALELPDGRRLVFKPSADPPPTTSEGGLDWPQVVGITVVEVVDYHRD